MLPYILPMHLEFFILASSSLMLLLSETRQKSLSRYLSLNFEMSFENDRDNTQTQRQHSENLHIIFWIVGIGNTGLNIVALIGYALLHGEYVNNTKMPLVANGTELLIGITPSLACIYMFIGFHLLANALKMFPRNNRVVCERDNILLLCMAATVAYAVIGIFRVTSTTERRPSYNIIIFLFKDIAAILTAYYQTLFIHKTKSVLQSLTCSDDIKNVRILQHALLNVSMYSLTIWLIDTFFSAKLRPEIILDSILWNVVRQVLFPFAKYFRFQSSFETFRLYQRCKSLWQYDTC